MAVGWGQHSGGLCLCRAKPKKTPYPYPYRNLIPGRGRNSLPPFPTQRKQRQGWICSNRSPEIISLTKHRVWTHISLQLTQICLYSISHRHADTHVPLHARRRSPLPTPIKSHLEPHQRLQHLQGSPHPRDPRSSQQLRGEELRPGIPGAASTERSPVGPCASTPSSQQRQPQNGTAGRFGILLLLFPQL